MAYVFYIFYNIYIYEYASIFKLATLRLADFEINCEFQA